VRLERRKKFIAATRRIRVDYLDNTLAEELKRLMLEVSEQLAAQKQQQKGQAEEQQEESGSNEGVELQNEEEEEEEDNEEEGDKEEEDNEKENDDEEVVELDESREVVQQEKAHANGKVINKMKTRNHGAKRVRDAEESNTRKKNGQGEKGGGRKKRTNKRKEEEKTGEEQPRKERRNGKQEEEEEEEKETPVELLKRMKESVPVVEALIKSFSGKKVGVGMLVPPDPKAADPEQGEILLKDQNLLSRVLSGIINEVAPVGKLGRVHEWWDLCRLSFFMAAILAALRQKSSRHLLRGPFCILLIP
jgi:hypothetical protein